ncbi:MAG: metal-dependent transcriptional regulator [Mycobacteriaceae bacterium]
MFEDYLTAVFKSGEWDDTATTSDLAALLGVTASTVSATLKKLAREGFLDYEPYGRFSLTDTGRGVALGVLRRRRIIETYLAEKLDLRPDEVHDEADRLEHAVSPRVLEQMFIAVGQPSFDPHGDPIPDADGVMPGKRTIGLLDMPLEDAATWRVARVRDSDPAVVRYLAGHGIVFRADIRLIARMPQVGTVTVDVDGRVLDLPEAVASAVKVRKA